MTAIKTIEGVLGRLVDEIIAEVVGHFEDKNNIIGDLEAQAKREIKQVVCGDIIKKLPKKWGADKLNFGRGLSCEEGIENGKVYGYNQVIDEIRKAIQQYIQGKD